MIARILMEFEGTVPLLYLKFQRLKKTVPVINWSIFTRHILYLSVNTVVTAKEVWHSVKVSSFITYLQGHKCMQCEF
jgi:hypothetical protein